MKFLLSHNEIPLLGEEIILVVIICLYIYFTHPCFDCFALYVRTCSFMLYGFGGYVFSGSKEACKKKKKKPGEKRKVNEINKGDRNVRSLSYRMVMSFPFCS